MCNEDMGYLDQCCQNERILRAIRQDLLGVEDVASANVQKWVLYEF